MIFFFALVPAILADVPTFELKNAAVAGLKMPAIGIGTGGYSTIPNGYGVYPECWNEETGCGDYVVQAITSWLQAGGRRIDTANDYYSDKSIAKAIQKVGIKREDLFILSKVGPVYPLGYQDSLQQFQDILVNLNTTYVDLLLIHWPSSDPNNPPKGTTLDPTCIRNTTTYNEVQCRLNTWKGLVQIWQTGGAKAIGVSNYNISHLQEIKDASLPLPSYNQCPYHLYRSTTQQPLKDFCTTNNIIFGGYSPLGVPDWHVFPGPKMAPTPLQDPIAAQVAKKYAVTPAQVLLNWQYRLQVPTNPRCQNLKHMQDNLNAYNFTLTQDDINLLLSAPQDYCSMDPDFYECAPDMFTWDQWSNLLV